MERRAHRDSLRRAAQTVGSLPDSIPLPVPAVAVDDMVAVDSLNAASGRPELVPADTLLILNSASAQASLDSAGVARSPIRVFDPDPIRAVWLSALCPGLGQVYNRRYWKLPIVVGAFMGLAYGTSWNNGMLRDYTRAYNDITDNDPTTKSYMDFYPSTTREEDLDKSWLTQTLKHRKDYFRRNRDLCIISMIGVYLVAMVDAYVDASLAHFDISEDLSLDIGPAVIPDSRDRLPSLGLQWAFHF
ncbi:MAG: DUF5683 domain-containing protein [Clostridium sp.]|nr:DUF5683 domain-containing protein [Clostridium sp.]